MNVFKFEFRRLLKAAIIWGIACGLLIIMFMSFYPSMKDSGLQELISTKLDAFPPAMMEAFNISGAVDFSKIADYTAYVIQYIAMAAGVYGAILGVSALVKEESEGTIEFLYSKPITRSKIVTAKLLSSAAIFMIFMIIVGAITMGVSIIVKPEDVEIMTLIVDVKTILIGMAFLGYIFMAVGFLISVLLKNGKQAISISLGIFFTTYVLGVIGKLKESLKGFLYLSPFEYVAPANIIKDGFDMKFVLLGLGIIVVSIVITYVIYNKKDLAI
ncbi:MAG: ABC transporter permease subunit [Clostridium sp.]|uniref:ABC transporter permease subunit n=1 Tax=Clostridium sp. TaxID=1506 RepID=UPI0030364771